MAPLLEITQKMTKKVPKKLGPLCLNSEIQWKNVIFQDPRDLSLPLLIWLKCRALLILISKKRCHCMHFHCRLDPQKNKRAIVVVCVELDLVSKSCFYIAFTWMALLCNMKLAHKHTVCVPACPLVMSGRKKFPTEYLGSLWFFLHNGQFRAFWGKVTK